MTCCMLVLWRFHSKGRESAGMQPDVGKEGDALEEGLVIQHAWDKVVFNRCPSGSEVNQLLTRRQG